MSLPLRRWLAPAAALMTVAVTVPAFGHIRLEEPPSRFIYSGAGQKTPMCGEGTATNTVTTFTPGQTITVEWSETINHPGHFRISVDPDGGEDDLVDPSDYDDFYVAESVLADEIIDEGGSTFSQQVTLPNVECELCTLQLIQVMTDKPPWGPEGGDDIYYWCADIRLSNTPDPTTSSTGGGTGEGGTTGDGGTSAAGGAPGSGGSGGSSGDGETDGEEGCSAAPGGGSSAAVALVLALAALRRRRRS